jgi:hypothetical protein
MGIQVKVSGKGIKAIIDSGAEGNFMSLEWAKENQIPRIPKQNRYFLEMYNGKAIENPVTEETLPILVDIQQHQEKMVFDLVSRTDRDVVIGIPWLRYHNPTINWKTSKFTFDGCQCMNDTIPARKIVNHPTDERRILGEVSISKKDVHKISESDSGDTDVADHETRVNRRKNHAPSEVPSEYNEWLHLFKEETTIAALPEHKPWDHEIILEPGKQPTFKPIYALSEKELGILREYLEENLKKGFIRKSTSPAGYPILFAPKKDGNLRLCVDYRQLNEITIKNRYPLPNIQELQDRLQGANYFTKLDLRGAYNLIRMKEGEEWKTAFRTRYGHYEYTVMPFGLTNAPATCQQLINDTLRTLLDKCVVAYLDDILVYSKDLKQHIKDVNETLRLLDQKNLRLKLSKCEFHTQETEFLGFIIGINGISMDKKKIQSVKEWPKPTNLKEVQGFLGFTNYNRRFIKDYAKKAAPLSQLTKKDQPFEWKEPQEKAFQELIEACSSDPLLKLFDPKKPIQIETDASDLAIGACLSQQYDKKWHPVAYYSRKMSPAEQNYDIHDKELLAIVVSLEHWRVYAEGAPELTILTDHKNLLYFTTTKTLNRRQVRWSELLGQYKFTIKYTPGKENGRADALSRRSDYMKKEPMNHSILKIANDGTITGNTRALHMATIILEDELEQFPISKGKLQVPTEKVIEIIRKYHDGPLQGHPGIGKTIKEIQRNYVFPNMKEEVSNYISKCQQCNQNKASRQKKMGEIQMIPAPTEPWEEVTMDFITKSPKSEDPATKITYDSILVVVDRLTKYSHYIPFQESWTAEQLTHVLMDRVIRIRGIPRTYITDRDKLFTSNYWKTITAMMGTKHKLSTAYHPQTDGQTERSNQTLEVYLRHFVNQRQDNWVSLLPMAELALNNQVSSTTNHSPNEANNGRQLAVRREQLENRNAAESAIQKMKRINETIAEITNTITINNGKVTKRENQKRRKGPQLKKGDKVYLLTKNLKTKRPSKKLDNIKVGPFLIKAVKGTVNYELELPKDAKIHSTFHISLLEPADPDTPLQETFHYEVEEEDTFEVETILQEKNGQYLIKWKGYPDSENSWEPLKNLGNCKMKLQEFRKHTQGKERQRRNPTTTHL